MRRDRISKLSGYILAEMQREEQMVKEYKRRKQYEKSSMYNNGRKDMDGSKEESETGKQDIE